MREVPVGTPLASAVLPAGKGKAYFLPLFFLPFFCFLDLPLGGFLSACSAMTVTSIRFPE